MGLDPVQKSDDSELSKTSFHSEILNPKKCLHVLPLNTKPKK